MRVQPVLVFFIVLRRDLHHSQQVNKYSTSVSSKADLLGFHADLLSFHAVQLSAPDKCLLFYSV